MTRTLRLWSTLGAITALSVMNALAFSGKEHVCVSNRGFRFANEYIQNNATAGRLLEKGIENIESVLGDLKYGALVRSADHLINSVQYIEEWGCVLDYPPEITERRKSNFEILEQWIYRVHAAHNNDVHFQAEALSTFWFLHATALAIAARGYERHPKSPSLANADESGQNLSVAWRDCFLRRAAEDDPRQRLHAALMINAYADHFLEDMFAPGHVITPRYAMHDAVAGAMHDRYNLMGAEFKVEKCQWEKLKQLMGTEYRKCDGDPDWSGDPAPAMESIDKKLAFVLLGDGELRKSREQGVFLSLLVARSVLDVIESFAEEEALNSFWGYAWRPMREVKSGLTTAHFSLPQGEFDPRNTGGTLYAGPAIGLGYSFDYFASHCCDEPGRGMFTAEYLTSILPPGRKDDDGYYHRKRFQFGVVPSYSYVWNSQINGHGPSLRLVLAFPKADIKVSGEAGYRWYRADGGTEYEGTRLGARFDLGFSLMTLNLGMYRDHGRDRVANFFGFSEQIRPGWAVNAGINVGIPLTRVPITKQFIRWRLEKRRPTIEDEKLDVVSQDCDSVPDGTN